MRPLLLPLLSLFMLAGPAAAWQQRVAYDIEARLDTVKHELTAEQRLGYWNNSPDTLSFVWLHLYPNAFRDNSTHFARESESFHDYGLRLAKPEDLGFIEVGTISAGGGRLVLEYSGDPTSARVRLPSPLAPGDSAVFDISFRVKVPRIFCRLGRQGAHYEVSQWYPKMAVYDRRGWHPDGYHYLGEFYGEIGDFKVGLWLPRNMVVGATGMEVADPADTTTASDSLSYHLFAASDVHDFAWCADPKYSDTTEVHGGVAIRVLAMERDAGRWDSVMRYAKDALDYYGRWYGKYPYPSLTVCGGHLAAGGGMEYPNLVIVSSGEDRLTRSLEMTVMHEIGHQWFYGMLANDEMAEPWMDEGFNSFSEERYFEEKYGPEGNFLAKPSLRRWLPELSDRYIGYMMYYMLAAARMEQPMDTRPYLSKDPVAYASNAYKKPAMLFWWLREFLGEAEFDRLMRGYFRRCRHRHVDWDGFLAFADSATGRPVSEHLDPWFHTAARCDNGIAAVRKVGGHRNLYAINVVRSDSLSLPSRLLVKDRMGNADTILWNGRDRSMWFTVRTAAPVKDVVLDPEGDIPDFNRFNNCWPRRYSLTLGPRLPSPGKYQMFALPIPWYDGVNGFRLGPFLHGGYMMDGGPMTGRHQWTFFPYYGFKSREVSFSLAYQTPVGALAMPPRAYFSAGKGSDTRAVSLGLMRSWGRALFAPTESFDLHLDYNRIVDTSRFLDWRDAEPGSNVILTLSRGSALSAYRAGIASSASASGGFLLDSDSTANSFSRFSLEERAYLRVWRRQLVDLRAFFGSIAGQAPAQEQYFLSGAYKTSGINAVIVSGRDWFSAQEHYHVEGSADVPGYLGRHLRGRLAASANLSVPLYSYPVALFADAALLGDEYDQLSIKQTYCDAGVSLQLKGVKFLFPLWINRPLEGEKRIDFRWKVGLGGAISLGH